MTQHQLPLEAQVFSRYLSELSALLDQSAGWCGVFWQRDPDGMRACLDGVEVPPWDVVEALLHDLAGIRGAEAAELTSVFARELHSAAAAAYDRLPGGREALVERLELMLREQAYAAHRAEELLHRMGVQPGGGPEGERLATELAWVRDDHARATARVGEFRGRLAAHPDAAVATAVPAPAAGAPESAVSESSAPGPSAPGPFVPESAVSESSAPGPSAPGPSVPESAVSEASDWFRPAPLAPQAPLGPGVRPGPGGHPSPEAHPAPENRTQPQPDPAPRPEPSRPRKPRRPRGARFAGVDETADAAPAAPVAPVLSAATPATPRGARFGGSPADAPAPAAPPAPEAARQAARETVAALGRLRAEGRSGEAHVVLCEAAARPADWLPVFAAELCGAGLSADWATLLWEAASQPAPRLAAAASALAAAGRADDSRQLLRQGVARPPADIAAAALALEDEGGGREAHALLTAFARSRTPEETASIAESAPRRLVPRLLDAARAVSSARERDLVHALRVAGHLA
ncbi:hypothetical protein [Streptomyces sp. MUM 178J]|uniref:hypothetical protein n=1 Tax=Streptomyces sp. MUM 178J TaxID=2791991 RepID=UPI001F03D2DD|nr:hypothetical protein [Streptomyces sp. MUM 178J]WRQ80268.1 hypothetical protein I3F59_013405 [Streptomyces sp. MUM 178J]